MFILTLSPEEIGSKFLSNVVSSYKSIRRHNPEEQHQHKVYKFEKNYSGKFLDLRRMRDVGSLICHIM
jgi:hypothetical protein